MAVGKTAPAALPAPRAGYLSGQRARNRIARAATYAVLVACSALVLASRSMASCFERCASAAPSRTRSLNTAVRTGSFGSIFRPEATASRASVRRPAVNC